MAQSGLSRKEKIQLWWGLTRKYVFIALVLITLCPIPIIINTQMGYVAFTIFLMGTFWVTEVIPLPVTALIPIVLFPLFGIRDSPTVVEQYFKDVTYMVFGGLILAAAIEHQNLHRRFALRVLLLFGTDSKRLLLGFMSGTAFLSSWMSNTAVTAMMLPIARAVLDEIKKQDNNGEHEMECDLGENREYKPNNQTDLPPEKQIKGNRNGQELQREEMDSVVDLPPSRSSDDQDKRHLRLCKAIFLCIPYAANVGGTGSLVGTPANVVCVAVVESLFGKDTGLNFGTWTLYCYPQMIVCVLLIWVWLQFMYLPWNSFRCKSNRESASKSKEIRKVIQRAYDDLGPVRFAEWAILAHFVIIITLWITQDPKVFPGWASLFPPGVKSSAPTILIAISLFCFPSERPLRLIRIRDRQMHESANSHLERIVANGESASVAGGNSDEDDIDGDNGRESRPKIAKVKCIPALINWEIVHEKIPWGVLIVVGGGFALADGCVESGLSLWLAEQFEIFYGIPPLAVAFITAIILSVLTELTANVVTTTIFLPIVAEMAVAMRINPLYLMLTTTICASFAFMLPVATPPNAIAFANKEITVIDMVKTGCLLNFTCICILLLFMNTLGRLIFDIAHFPDWANNTMNAMATDNIFHNSTSVPF
ncbi:solute carrier family 13 member 5-like isoform X2 [Lytechinus variegatus]|uniref:solute carrier family 13 member 5-like isoform X2 n=1 Tax=Lytechinus variegatus TaxID=7654 RepID=UPI001BB2627B|nr:solute carrier family 13 member 5-like isoform X2 [Lytechinus variegatus]